MTQDYSIYERGNPTRVDQSEGISFGRVWKVNTETRLCEVHTFGGNNNKNDRVVECQWLSLDAHPEGDESTSILRPGTIGLVFHVGGEAFFFGSMKPLREDKGATTGNEPSSLTEGDKVIATDKGNKITVKSSGLIEIEANQELRRVYFPAGNRMLDICNAYEMWADGGKVSWKTIDELNQTKYSREIRRDIARSFVIVEDIGAVDATTLYNFAIGPGVPGVEGVPLPIYNHSVDATGKHTFSIKPPGVPMAVGMEAEIHPDGSFTIASGTAPNQFAMDFSGLTGDTSIEINRLAKVFISGTGDVEVVGPVASLKMSMAGEVTVDGPTGIKLSAKKGIDIESVGPVNVTAKAPITIKGITVNIDGGTGTSDFVLTNPTTLSPFTGNPLVPFSATVKVSK